MRLMHLEPQLKRNYLYEGLGDSDRTSAMLWETAGHELREAALTADQIQNLFKEIEAGATAAGDNRTMLGKGKDAVSAVNKAWEDLKTKMQDSGPVKGFDQKVSDALSKIGMGAAEPEFNGQVNKWVQKYRDFAKKHPIAQGAIYATLIALAGITGAGIGGAAALGLLKMADQLLQGKRFSSAAYSGVKAGALAFAASKLGDLIKGAKPGEQIPVSPEDSAAWQAVKRDFENYDYYLHPSNDSVIAVPKGMGNPFDPSTAAGAARDQLTNMSAGALRDQARSIADRAVEDALKSGVTRPNELADAAAMAMEKAGVGTNVGGKLSVQTVERIADQAADAARSVSSGAAKGAAQSAGTSAADMAASISDVPAGGGIKAPDFDAGDAVSKAADASSSMPKGATFSPDYLQGVVDGEISRPKISASDAQAALDWQAQNGGQSKINLGATDPVPPEEAGKTRPFANKTRMPASDVQTTTAPDGTTTTTGTLKGVTSDQIQSHPAYKAEIERGGDNPESRRAAAMKARAALLKGEIGAGDTVPPDQAAEQPLRLRPRIKRPAESRTYPGRKLSEGQVYMVINRVCAKNQQMLAEGLIFEGPWDAIKGAASKGMDWVKTKGKNLTTKVTADKLTSAWKSAGSPMDSNAIADLLKAQGVADTVISSVYSQLKLPAPGAADQAGTVDIETVKQMIAKLPTDRKVRLINYMTKQLKVA